MINVENQFGLEAEKESPQVEQKTTAEIIAEGGEMVKNVLDQIKAEYEKKTEGQGEFESDGKKILIIDCSGSLLLGPLTVLADKKLDKGNTITVDIISHPEELPDSFENIAGVIFTGSAANIEDKSKPDCQWIKKAENVMTDAIKSDVPVLGVCFGIQMFADVSGREVPKNEGGREMGIWKTSIYRDEKMPQYPIFKDIDFQKDPNSDKESAVIETVGSHAFRAGYSRDDRQNLYGFHYTNESHAYPQIEINKNFTGLQFHPELSSPLGLKLLEAVVKARYQVLKEDKKDPETILRELDSYNKRIGNGEKNSNLLFLENFTEWALNEK